MFPTTMMSKAFMSRSCLTSFSEQKRTAMVLNYSTAKKLLFPVGCGAGMRNVQDKMLPSCGEESNAMYKHLKRPKTVSIIG